MAEIGAHQVEIYDPESPDDPVVILAANFDPHTMQRWDHRHVTAPLPERGMVAEQHDGETDVGEEEADGRDGEEAAFRFERESGAHGTGDPRFATTEAASDATKE